MKNLSSPPVVKVFVLPNAEDIKLPCYETAGASGMDLRAAIETPITLKPFERRLIPTGLVFELPAHFEGQVRPRSGLALKHGITCLNTPGTIDSDYRGELKVLLINLGQDAFIIERHMRIAQLIIAPVAQAYLERHEVVVESVRGNNGFGSTGLR